MSKAPIETILDRLDWQEIPGDVLVDDGLPYATHSGVLDIGGFVLRCYQLSDGQRLFDAEDVERFYSEFLGSNKGR